jgi:uncharacterized protein YjbJ (UPF0337 family)
MQLPGVAWAQPRPPVAVHPEQPITQDEANMSSSGDKARGMGNEAMGKIKQGVGEATGNQGMRQEGQIQERKGEAQQIKGDVKETLKKGIDKA